MSRATLVRAVGGIVIIWRRVRIVVLALSVWGGGQWGKYLIFFSLDDFSGVYDKYTFLYACFSGAQRILRLHFLIVPGARSAPNDPCNTHTLLPQGGRVSPEFRYLDTHRGGNVILKKDGTAIKRFFSSVFVTNHIRNPTGSHHYLPRKPIISLIFVSNLMRLF